MIATIIIIVSAVLIVAGVITGYFVRKLQGKSGCSGCSSCPSCKERGCPRGHLGVE